MEIWRTIPNTNGHYQVSNKGRVMTTTTEKIHTPVVDERGYERVSLYKVDKKRRFKVHRLVAITFIPNPDNKKQVNHKDGNKRNNRVENLEWASNEENMKHSRAIGLHDGHKRYCEKIKKPIIATCIATGEQIVFDSILAAKKAIGTTHIQQVLKGVRHEAKGYTFKYAKGG